MGTFSVRSFGKHVSQGKVRCGATLRGAGWVRQKREEVGHLDIVGAVRRAESEQGAAGRQQGGGQRRLSAGAMGLGLQWSVSFTTCGMSAPITGHQGFREGHQGKCMAWVEGDFGQKPDMTEMMVVAAC